MAIDFSTNIGRLRLRVADVGDLSYLPDSVYTQVLADNDDNLPRSAVTLAIYILGQLAFKTHRKLAQLEVYGSEAFENYRKFLLMTVTNPAFMDISPVPPNIFGTDLHPLMQFTEDWNNNYSAGTQSQNLHWDAIGSPNNTDGNWQWNS